MTSAILKVFLCVCASVFVYLCALHSEQDSYVRINFFPMPGLCVYSVFFPPFVSRLSRTLHHFSLYLFLNYSVWNALAAFQMHLSQQRDRKRERRLQKSANKINICTYMYIYSIFNNKYAALSHRTHSFCALCVALCTVGIDLNFELNFSNLPTSCVGAELSYFCVCYLVFN